MSIATCRLRWMIPVVVLAGCTVGEDGPPIIAAADQPLPPELHAGDVVRAGDLELVVPDPGETVGITAHQDDGSTVELVVDNPLDGPVTVVKPPVDGATTAQSLAVATECTDRAYALEGFHWAADYHWAFQAGSTPSANTPANVAAGLQVGANAITNQRNSCGLVDQVSATNSYAGVTTAGPNIPNSTTTISCGTRDNANVVGFGVLPPTYLAITCYWYSNKVALEADVKFSRTHRWFAQAVPAGCSNTFGIEQVATHEFGHAFGLAHVAQATHSTQTMSPISAPCTNSKVTLGLGDVSGLRALY
jgi:hypothetical protein